MDEKREVVNIEREAVDITIDMEKESWGGWGDEEQENDTMKERDR